MTGEEFERRLEAIYRGAGWDVAGTARAGDFGADLVAERASRRLVVQAKRSSGSVGIGAVQEVIGAQRFYGADEAAVVTNATFTRAARALAASDGVTLVERDALAEMLAAQARASSPAAPVLLVRQVGAGAALVGLCGLAALRLAGRALLGASRGRGRA
jgi:restriction system protein